MRALHSFMYFLHVPLYHEIVPCFESADIALDCICPAIGVWDFATFFRVVVVVLQVNGPVFLEILETFGVVPAHCASEFGLLRHYCRQRSLKLWVVPAVFTSTGKGNCYDWWPEIFCVQTKTSSFYFGDYQMRKILSGLPPFTKVLQEAYYVI